MNAVCTIVSKNYLAQALTLGDSLKETNPNTEFHILLADEKEDLCLEDFAYHIIEFKNLGYDFWEDMAFKYDVIEFNTATKPFFMQWLIGEYGYEKLLYIDPDCIVYSKLDFVFNELNENFIAMTPHIIDPQLVDSSAIPETEHLFDGIYNFGFVGIKNSKEGNYILQWWANRLKILGYADRYESLHVDQKWMDFVPSMFDSGVKILRHYGYNMSHWNFHERMLSKEKGKYLVNKKNELVIFHFSGYDPLNKYTLTKTSKQKKFNMNNRKDLRIIHQNYREKILKNKFEEFYKMDYAYGFYNNKKVISKLNRRLYRKLNDEGFSFEKPFESNSEFYKLMDSDGLISNIVALVDISKTSYSNIDKKEKMLKMILRLAKKVLGIDNYMSLLKGMSKYSRYENQFFVFLDK